MLERVALKNFKGFVDVNARIAPFTLLVGENASGKSNFLDALRLLHGLSLGWSVGEVLGGKTEGSTEVWSGIRGGRGGLVHYGQSTTTIESQWEIAGDGYPHEIVTDGSSITHERLSNHYRASCPASNSSKLDITWESGLGQTPNVPTSVDARRSVFGSVPATWVSEFRMAVAAIDFFEPAVAEMRTYSEKGAPGQRVSMARNGHNLSSVLWNICQTESKRSTMVDWLVEFCAPEIEDLEFEETDSGFVMLRVVEKGGAKVSARSMSDGTLRFLSILTALRDAGVLVIEDLDFGFHPSRIGMLCQAIRDAVGFAHSKRPTGGPRVLATTHSPTLVDAALSLPREECSVLLCARTPDSEAATITEVSSIPGFEEVHAKRNFQYLLETGWLERAI